MSRTSLKILSFCVFFILHEAEVVISKFPLMLVWEIFFLLINYAKKTKKKKE